MPETNVEAEARLDDLSGSKPRTGGVCAACRPPGARNTARSTLHCGFWQGRMPFPGAQGPGDCQGWTKKRPVLGTPGGKF